MITLLLLAGLAYADDIVTLNKGESAPFTGTLLSPSAAAKVLVESDSSIQRCRIEAEKAASLAEAKYNLEIGNKDASLAACHLKYTEMSRLYEEQLKFLERQAVMPQWETPVYFTVGVLTGVAMFYGSSLVVKNLQ